MRISVLIIALSFTLSAFAQDYDFGKVSKEELQEKFNPLDSTACAAYLYKYRKTYYQYIQGKGFQLITEIHERLKIYNQEGFSYATNEVLLYKNDGDWEKMTNLKAYTYNLVDNKIEETKLKKDGIFNKELNKFRDIDKFTMPNVKEGSVIEYEYKIISPYYTNVDEFLFQKDIPIKKVEAIFEAPEYFNFRVNVKGFLNVIPKTETKQGRIKFSNSNRTGWNQTGKIVRTEYSTNEVEFIKTAYVYNLENIPALKDEPYVNSINNYKSSVKYELSYTKFPESAIKYYTTSWEDVVKSIYDNPSFGSELDKSGYYKDEVDAIKSTISDPMAKASSIYDLVKSLVKWNGYYGKYCDDGVINAYKNHVGNVAEINLMLTSMLRYAGLNANPVLISTRQNGVPLFPTREGYNYVISCIETPNGVILLDATNKYGAPNILPSRALNWEGRIVRKDKTSSTVNLYPNEKSKKMVSLFLSLDAEGTINGGIRNIKTAHSALAYRENYLNVDKNQYLENLENEYNGMEISDFEVKNDTDLSKPVMETFKFTSANQADIIGDKIYFSPLFFLRTKESPFKLEKREFPIDFGYPSSNKYTIVVNLPEGYEIEAIPESAVVAMPDNLGSFKYNISPSNNKIQIVVESEINQSIISPLYYDTVKTFFSKLIEKEAEQIVLSKV